MMQASLFDPSTITYDSAALEAHYTPDWLAEWVVDTVLPELGVPRRARVLEPHAGGGAFIRALWRHPMIEVHGVDVDRNCWAVRQGGASVCDFLGDHTFHEAELDLVLGNPPFSNAEIHIRRGLELAPRVVFILPVSRLETTTRARWYHEHSGLHQLRLLPERVWPGSRHIGVFSFRRGHRGPFSTSLEPSVQPGG
jgi:hypothetical protein